MSSSALPGNPVCGNLFFNLCKGVSTHLSFLSNFLLLWLLAARKVHKLNQSLCTFIDQATRSNWANTILVTSSKLVVCVILSHWSQSEHADFVLLIVNVLQHPTTTTCQFLVLSLLGGDFSVCWREPPADHRAKLSHRELPSALPTLCNGVRCSTWSCCPTRDVRTSLVASILEVVGQMRPLTPCSYRNCPVISLLGHSAVMYVVQYECLLGSAQTKGSRPGSPLLIVLAFLRIFLGRVGNQNWLVVWRGS